MADADEKSAVLLCSECFAELGGRSCGDHPDDPPIDPAKPDVQDLLADKDDEALASLRRKYMGFAAMPGVLTLGGLLAFNAASDFGIPRVFVGGAFGVVTLAGLTFGRRQANRRFKPRFARWTGRDYVIGEDIEKMIEQSRRSPDDD